MFKRTCIALSILVAMLCFGLVEVDARDIGNGGGQDGGFHERVFEPFSSDTSQTQPVKPPTTPTTTIEPPVHQPLQPTVSETYNADDEWLIYWYICGTDLEANDSSASKDISEMEKVQLPPNVKVLIQTGTASQWHHPTVNSNGRYIFDSNGLKKISNDTGNMYEGETLKSFLEYGEQAYRSDHRILIIWNHGGVGGVCQDHEFTGKIMSLNDLSGAIKAVYGNSPAKPPFEIIGFDACLMGSYECANNIYGLARYMVASEANESSQGWYYTDWLNELANNPATNGKILGSIICSSSLEVTFASSMRTFSAVDMSCFNQVRNAHEEYFKQAFNHARNSARFITDFDSLLQQKEQNAQGEEVTSIESYSESYVDLKSLARSTKHLLPEASINLIKAIDNAVIGKPSNGTLRTGGGISTYYPYGKSIRKAYLEQDSASVNQKEFYNMIKQGTLYVGNAVTNQTGKSDKSESGFNVAALHRHPVTADNVQKQIFVKLTSKELESVSKITCMVVKNVDNPNSEYGEVSIILGTNFAVKGDRETGIFRSDLKGVFPTLDGHLISMERTFTGNGYELYSSPIKLNGVPRLLQISYNHSTNEYKIESIGKELDEDGMGSRDIDFLKEGDELTPMFAVFSDNDSDGIILQRFYDDKGNFVGALKVTEGKSFKVGKFPKVTEEILDEEDIIDYGYIFIFHAPDGTAAFSEVAYFTVSDGEVDYVFTTEHVEE